MKLEMRAREVVRLGGWEGRGTEMPQSHVSDASQYFGLLQRQKFLFPFFFFLKPPCRGQGLRCCRVEKHDGSMMEGWNDAFR